MPLPHDVAAKLIGLIYESGVDPSNWPVAIEAMCSALDCHVGSLTILDRTNDPPSLVATYRGGMVDNQWMDLHTANNYAADFMMFFEQAMARPGIDPDTPLVISHVMDRQTYRQLRVVQEWAGPQGFCDCMSVVVLDSPGRFSSIDLIRHERQGLVGDFEFRAFAALAPHLRRAVGISNMMGLQTLEANVLSKALTGDQAAIVLVDAAARVLHANAEAGAMLARGSPIAASDGVLQALTPEATEALHVALAEVARTVPPRPLAPAPIPLPHDGADVMLAHILPLGHDALRTIVMKRPSAAVLIMAQSAGLERKVATLAGVYHLTPTEQRLLRRLAAGEPLPEAALALGIEMSTVRTHLGRLFTKTGTRRQAELVALVARVQPRT